MLFTLSPIPGASRPGFKAVFLKELGFESVATKTGFLEPKASFQFPALPSPQ